jgi:aryl-alcohol dehydrogenase-like predicted oxidoreductase
MERIRLGRTGMLVSRLGFGGIPIQRDTEEEAIAIVRRCLELDINFLDTANAYTTSEERIGKAIAGRKREELVIATKTTSRSRDGVARHLELILKRLACGLIDLYQFHNISDAESLLAFYPSWQKIATSICAGHHSRPVPRRPAGKSTVALGVPSASSASHRELLCRQERIGNYNCRRGARGDY